MKEKILIVEDQFIEANNLRTILLRAGYSVCEIASSVPAALAIVEKERPDFVLLDIFLQGKLTGIDLAQLLREKQIAFVYLSANSNAQTLDAAKATVPYGFLIKPFREKDILTMLEIARYQHQNGLDAVCRRGRALPPGLSPVAVENPFAGLIGKSAKMKEVTNLIQMVGPTDTSVLILGETGTGKERVAECIHTFSPRKARPMVKVNCAALPPALVESVLFGHEKGAFTGAGEKLIGKFEQADNSTLFLDEIGELHPGMQAKLLRVLQEREIERIGSNETIPIDVRIITATNSNLERAVSEGRFRIDLYYRLYVFPIRVPPLRERIEDIPLLVAYFLEKYGRNAHRPGLTINKALLERLKENTWLGNVRELEHTIERTVVMSKGAVIDTLFLPPPLADAVLPHRDVKTMQENERDHILAVLRQCRGKVFGKNGAAEILKINSSTLQSRMKKLGIKKSDYKETDG